VVLAGAHEKVLILTLLSVEEADPKVGDTSANRPYNPLALFLPFAEETARGSLGLPPLVRRNLEI
jgi:hypothetical protein